jgi:hypothetical protein
VVSFFFGSVGLGVACLGLIRLFLDEHRGLSSVKKIFGRAFYLFVIMRNEASVVDPSVFGSCKIFYIKNKLLAPNFLFYLPLLVVLKESWQCWAAKISYY